MWKFVVVVSLVFAGCGFRSSESAPPVEQDWGAEEILVPEMLDFKRPELTPEELGRLDEAGEPLPPSVESRPPSALSFQPDQPTFMIYKESGGLAQYTYDVWWSGDPGEVWLKVLNSDGSQVELPVDETLMTAETSIAIQRTEFGDKFNLHDMAESDPLKFELWFRPGSGGEPILVDSAVYQIERWFR